MPAIEVTTETLSRLAALARPFVDTTPEAVILRLLDGQSETKLQRPDASRPRRRAQVGTLLPEKAYWIPILQALDEQGGEAPAVDVIARVGEILENDLTDDDKSSTGTGETRWKNRTQFARLRMKEQGWINPNSPRGVWAMTEEGREQLADARSRGDV